MFNNNILLCCWSQPWSTIFCSAQVWMGKRPKDIWVGVSFLNLLHQAIVFRIWASPPSKSLLWFVKTKAEPAIIMNQRQYRKALRTTTKQLFMGPFLQVQPLFKERNPFIHLKTNCMSMGFCQKSEL